MIDVGLKGKKKRSIKQHGYCGYAFERAYFSVHSMVAHVFVTFECAQVGPLGKSAYISIQGKALYGAYSRHSLVFSFFFAYELFIPTE